MPSRRNRSCVLLAVAGSAGAIAVWLTLVGWDLSEETAQGDHISGGGDHLAGRMALTLAVVFSLALALGTSRHGQQRAVSFQIGAATAWSLLFAWRAAAARTSGPNLWPIPFVVFVIPLAIITVALVKALAPRLNGRVRH